MPNISRHTLYSLLLAGQRMSNLCFNLGQTKNEHAHSMNECYKLWDDANTMLHAELKPSKKARKMQAEATQ